MFTVALLYSHTFETGKLGDCMEVWLYMNSPYSHSYIKYIKMVTIKRVNNKQKIHYWVDFLFYLYVGVLKSLACSPVSRHILVSPTIKIYGHNLNGLRYNWKKRSCELTWPLPRNMHLFTLHYNNWVKLVLGVNNIRTSLLCKKMWKWLKFMKNCQMY